MFNNTKPARGLSDLGEKSIGQIVRSESSDELHNLSDALPSLFEMMFVEAAVSTDEALSNGVGLLVKEEKEYDSLVLILISKNNLEKELKRTSKHKSKSFSDVLKNCIVGRIGINKYSNNLDKVGSIATEENYGPLLYDLAMSLEKNWLCPDNHPREAAENVWKYYYKKRSDVQKKLISDFIGYEDRQHDHPNKPWLWYAYKIKQPLSNIENLIKVGDEIKEIIKKESFWHRPEYETDEVGREYFIKRYKETKPRDEYDE